jgi:hypothetical protein
MPRGRPRKQDTLLLKSAEMIGWALGGIEREIALTRERLATLTAQANVLRTKIGARGGASTRVEAGTLNEGAAGTRKRRRRKMSPEGRKRISEMMKKRWAERRKAKG